MTKVGGTTFTAVEAAAYTSSQNVPEGYEQSCGPANTMSALMGCWARLMHLWEEDPDSKVKEVEGRLWAFGYHGLQSCGDLIAAKSQGAMDDCMVVVTVIFNVHEERHVDHLKDVSAVIRAVDSLSGGRSTLMRPCANSGGACCTTVTRRGAPNSGWNLTN